MTDNIGIMGPEMPVGSTIILEDDTEYVVVEHGSFGVRLQAGDDAPPAEMSYDEWNEEYAPFVKEVAYPEQHVEQIVTTPALAPAPVHDQTMSVNAHLLADVDDAMAEFHEAESAYNTLKDQASVAKKDMDKAQEALNNAVEALLRGKVNRDGWPEDVPLAAVASVPAETPVEATETDDAWRTVTLDSLANPGIKPGVLKALAENKPPILTLGDLADLEKKGDWGLKMVKGIGKAAQDQISDATDAYWARKAQA